jgi:hypothetical protein
VSAATTPERTPEELWSAHLDAVENAARSIAQQAVDRRPPEPHDLVAPSLPAVPWPASLDERRREVMAVLAAATETVQQCRDDAARDLSALARPGIRSPHGYLDGRSLDLFG